MKYLYLLCALILFTSVPILTRAQHMGQGDHAASVYPTLTPDQRSLKRTKKARVVSVIDGLRLQLDSGEIVHLSGLDIPDLYFQEPGPISVAARELLETLFLEKEIDLYQVADKSARQNRMGHVLGHIMRHKDQVWAQGALLQAGYARVRTTLNHHALARDMYDIEHAARRAEHQDETLNLWHHEAYLVHDPESILNAKSGFQILEGKILKTGSSKNTVYLNFGANWKTDFTIGIDSKTRRLLSKEGYEPPTSWAGKTVRVRGWVEDYNGPYIKIDHAQAIVFVEEETKDAHNLDMRKQEPVKDALPHLRSSDLNQ